MIEPIHSIGLRPCVVITDCVTSGLFHGWACAEDVFLVSEAPVRREDVHKVAEAFKVEKAVSAPWHIEKALSVKAIVELPDGTMTMQPPDSIRFIEYVST